MEILVYILANYLMDSVVMALILGISSTVMALRHPGFVRQTFGDYLNPEEEEFEEVAEEGGDAVTEANEEKVLPEDGRNGNGTKDANGSGDDNDLCHISIEDFNENQMTRRHKPHLSGISGRRSDRVHESWRQSCCISSI